MLVVETIARIRRDHLVRGVPIKKIARDLRVSKNTVRKVVRGDETSYSYERKIQPMPKLGPWVDELERQLEANEKKPRRDRLSLLRIHEDLAALGYGGGYDAVRRYARTWRRRWRLLSPSQGFVPLSFDPGEAYQFDWSHEYARLSGVTTRVSTASFSNLISMSRIRRLQNTWFEDGNRHRRAGSHFYAIVPAVLLPLICSSSQPSPSGFCLVSILWITNDDRSFMSQRHIIRRPSGLPSRFWKHFPGKRRLVIFSATAMVHMGRSSVIDYLRWVSVIDPPLHDRPGRTVTSSV